MSEVKKIFQNQSICTWITREKKKDKLLLLNSDLLGLAPMDIFIVILPLVKKLHCKIKEN